MKGIKSFRRTFLLIAALYLACGISLLVWPAQSGLVICYVFGGISLLYGAVQIIRYCCNAAVSIFRYELVTGILCCAFGLFVILRADMVLAVLPFVFGCAIVFDDLKDACRMADVVAPEHLEVVTAVNFRRTGNQIAPISSNRTKEESL